MGSSCFSRKPALRKKKPISINISTSDTPTVSIRSALILLALATLASGAPWARMCTSGCSASKAAAVFSSCLAKRRAVCESDEAKAGASQASATLLSGQKKWPPTSVRPEAAPSSMPSMMTSFRPSGSLATICVAAPVSSAISSSLFFSICARAASGSMAALKAA